VAGAIYYDEIAAIEANGQVCNLPYDPLLKVHAVFDLGWNDNMTISMVQRLRSEIRIIDYIEDSHRTLDSYSSELKDRRYNWGGCYFPTTVSAGSQERQKLRGDHDGARMGRGAP